MKNYWLFKAEPDVYGIEHLAAETNQTGRWDGIRNYQARNFLRDKVAVDDEVFVYHSHCKNPGIVGVAHVVRAAYPDPSQFNPQSPYYDPKAQPEAPRWFAVDIQLKEKFAEIIPLTVLKHQAPLAQMVLLKQGRLSTQPVTPQEWKYILSLKN